jgi:hypothetical protein
MTHPRRLTAQLFPLVLSLFLCAPHASAVPNWDAPATDLGHQIATLTGPGTISLTLRNISSLSTDDIPVIRRSLFNSMYKLGVIVRAGSAPEAATIVRVTLSQTPIQYIWVAEVQQGPDTHVAIVTIPLAAPTATPQATPILLRKTLLFSQPEPILDADLLSLPSDPPNQPHLIVLSADQLSLYHYDDPASWTKDQTFPIPHTQPFPRDLRGKLQTDPSGNLKAYLPGVVCTATPPSALSTDRLAMACTNSDDPWPLGSRKAFYNASRDYFTGVMLPTPAVEPKPFFSATELIQKARTSTVFSGIDGQFSLFDGATLKPLAGSRDWGSDLAGIRSGCGSGAQLLVTASGDSTQDSLRAYEIEGREAIVASSPLPFDGHIAALWPTQSASSTAPAEAILILEKQQPQTFEAYRVSVVCNQ